MAAFVALSFAEHVVLCVPIFYLKFWIDRRNEDLSPYFNLLPEEITSSENVNILGSNYSQPGDLSMILGLKI